MGINLLDIKPHKVSRDLSGYITYIYGAPKTGKTTLATQMNGALLLAFSIFSGRPAGNAPELPVEIGQISITA